LTAAIPFVDLARSQAEVQDALDDAIAAVVRRGDFILGQDVRAFEEEFAAYTGAAHVVGVNSGTAAIALAVQAAGIGRGDEVVVPAHTYLASALGVLHAGATPVLCDVDETTGLIDLDSAAEVCGPRTAAVLAVHLYGAVCDMDAVNEFASSRGLAAIEDAAQAQGARWRGRRAGSLGRVAAFSFYPSKNLGAFGDAGAITTDDHAIADAARKLRNLGQRVKGEHEVLGYNERLDTLQAAVLRVKLRRLDHWNASRVTAARRYDERLPEAVARVGPRSEADDVYHLMAVRVEDRDRVIVSLGQAGIGTGIHYDRAVHEHTGVRGIEVRTELSRAERWAAEELSLPMFPLLRDDEVDRVCEELELALTGPRTAASAS
jgi:dTDP-3-amino-3,4,6-trideoxy-alpha-D-glucose transaminase